MTNLYFEIIDRILGISHIMLVSGIFSWEPLKPLETSDLTDPKGGEGADTREFKTVLGYLGSH